MSGIEDYRIVRSTFCGHAQECKSEDCDGCVEFEKHLTQTKCDLNYLCRIAHCVQKHDECYIRFVRDTAEKNKWIEFKNQIKAKNAEQMAYILRRSK